MANEVGEKEVRREESVEVQRGRRGGVSEDESVVIAEPAGEIE